LLTVCASARAQAADTPAAADAAAAPPPRAEAPPPPPPPADVEPGDTSAFGIFFNPLSIAFGFYGLELDYSPTHLVSINVSGQYYSHSESILGTEIKTSAFGGDIGAQLFFTGHKPMYGAYVYPRIAFAKAEASETGLPTANASLIGIGATVGYQWNWQPFAFRLGAGVMNYTVAAKGDPGSPAISLTGTLPALDLTIGFVF
jgi:hypothetical protein